MQHHSRSFLFAHRFTQCFSLLIGVLLLSGVSACSSRKKVVSTAPLPAPPTPRIEVEIPVEKPVIPSNAEAIRGVWLTTIYGLDWPSRRAVSTQDMASQRRELCRILDRLAEAHFNTVFFQVRHRGDVIYPSKIEPRVTIFTGGRNNYLDYDPLQFAIEECHKRGLSIHAWFVTFPLGNSSNLQTLGENSVWKKHRDWCFTLHNDWYLNPGHPEARSYISSVVREMVERYDLDGVHFDYVRYPDKMREKEDHNLYLRYGKGKSIGEWRTGNISAFLKEVSVKVRAVKPHILVSAAPLGKLRVLPAMPNVGWTARESVFQDPVVWYREGSVDFIVPMMYYRDNLFDPFLADWKAQIPGLPIVPGLAPYRIEDESKWTACDIENQMNASERLGMAGVCFYRELNIRPNRNGVDRVIARHFTAPARMPSFANRGANRPPRPSRLTIEDRGQYLEASWTMPSSWNSSKGTFNLYVSVPEGNLAGENFLLATLIPSTRYTFSKELLQPFSRAKTLEFRVEASSRSYVRGEASEAAILVKGN